MDSSECRLSRAALEACKVDLPCPRKPSLRTENVSQEQKKRVSIEMERESLR